MQFIKNILKASLGLALSLTAVGTLSAQTAIVYKNKAAGFDNVAGPAGFTLNLSNENLVASPGAADGDVTLQSIKVKWSATKDSAADAVYAYVCDMTDKVLVVSTNTVAEKPKGDFSIFTFSDETLSSVETYRVRFSTTKYAPGANLLRKTELSLHVSNEGSAESFMIIKTDGTSYLGNTRRWAPVVEIGVKGLIRHAVRTRHVRIKPLARTTTGNYTNTGLSLCEIGFYHKGVRLAVTVEVGSTVTTSKPYANENQGPEKLFDGIVANDNKWYWKDAPATFDDCTIDLMSGEGYDFVFDEYEFAMADVNGRNPIKWEVYTSDDGFTWELLDAQEYTTEEANAWPINSWTGIRYPVYSTKDEGGILNPTEVAWAGGNGQWLSQKLGEKDFSAMNVATFGNQEGEPAVSVSLLERVAAYGIKVDANTTSYAFTASGDHAENISLTVADIFNVNAPGQTISFGMPVAYSGQLIVDAGTVNFTTLGQAVGANTVKLNRLTSTNAQNQVAFAVPEGYTQELLRLDGAGVVAFTGKGAFTFTNRAPHDDFTGTIRVSDGLFFYKKRGASWSPFKNATVHIVAPARFEVGLPEEENHLGWPQTSKPIILEGAEARFYSREPLVRPIRLIGGKILLLKDIVASGCAMNLGDQVTLDVRATADATADKPTISTIGGMNATIDTVTGDPTIESGMLETTGGTIDVQNNAELHCYAKLGAPGKTNLRFTKRGAGKLVLFANPPTNENQTFPFEAGTIELRNAAQFAGGTSPSTLDFKSSTATLLLNAATVPQAINGRLTGAGRLHKIGKNRSLLRHASSTFDCQELIVDEGEVRFSADFATAGLRAVRVASGAALIVDPSATLGADQSVNAGAWSIMGDLTVGNWSEGESLGALSNIASNLTLDGAKVTLTRSANPSNRSFNVTANGAEIAVNKDARISLTGSSSMPTTIATGAHLTLGGDGDLAVLAPFKTGLNYQLNKAGNGHLSIEKPIMDRGELLIEAGTVTLAERDLLGAASIRVMRGAELILEDVNLTATSLSVDQGAKLRLRNTLNLGAPIQLLGDAPSADYNGKLSIGGQVYFGDAQTPTTGDISMGAFTPHAAGDYSTIDFSTGATTAGSEITAEDHLVLKTTTPNSVMTIDRPITCKSLTVTASVPYTLKFTNNAKVITSSIVNLGTAAVTLDLSELNDSELYLPALSSTIRSTYPVLIGRLSGAPAVQVILGYKDGKPLTSTPASIGLPERFSAQGYTASQKLFTRYGIYCIVALTTADGQMAPKRGALTLNIAATATDKTNVNHLFYKESNAKAQNLVAPFVAGALDFYNEFSVLNPTGSCLITGLSVCATRDDYKAILSTFLTESANRKITISNVPFKRYRAILYFSGATVDSTFSAPIINSRSYMGAEGYSLPYAADAWGRNSAGTATHEGANVIVSEPLTGSFEAILPVESGSANSLAALQLVEIPASYQKEDFSVRIHGAGDIDWATAEIYNPTTKTGTIELLSGTGDDWRTVVNNLTIKLTGAETQLIFPAGFAASGKVIIQGETAGVVDAGVAITKKLTIKCADDSLLLPASLVDVSTLSEVDWFVDVRSIVTPPKTRGHFHKAYFTAGTLKPQANSTLIFDGDQLATDLGGSPLTLASSTIIQNGAIETAIENHLVPTKFTAKDLILHGELEVNSGLILRADDRIVADKAQVNKVYTQAANSRLDVKGDFTFKAPEALTLGDLVVGGMLDLQNERAFLKRGAGSTTSLGGTKGPGALSIIEGGSLTLTNPAADAYAATTTLAEASIVVPRNTSIELGTPVTFAAPAGKVTKLQVNDGGALTLRVANVTTGDLVIEQGQVIARVAGALGNTTTTVKADGRLTVVAKSLTATLAFETGSTLEMLGELAVGGTWQVAKATSGTPKFMLNGEFIFGTLSSTGLFTRAGDPAPKTLTWQGDATGNGTWLAGDPTLTPWAGSLSFNNGDSVTFPALLDSNKKTITVAGTVTPKAFTFGAGASHYILTTDGRPNTAVLTLPGTTITPPSSTTFDLPVKFAGDFVYSGPGAALAFHLIGPDVTMQSQSATYANPITVPETSVLLFKVPQDAKQSLTELVNFGEGAHFIKEGTGTLELTKAPVFAEDKWNGVWQSINLTVVDGILSLGNALPADGNLVPVTGGRWGGVPSKYAPWHVANLQIQENASLYLRSEEVLRLGQATIFGRLDLFDYNAFHNKITLNGGTIYLYGGNSEGYPGVNITTSLTVAPNAARPSYLESISATDVKAAFRFSGPAKTISVGAKSDLVIRAPILFGSAENIANPETFTKAGPGRVTLESQLIKAPTIQVDDGELFIRDGLLNLAPEIVVGPAKTVDGVKTAPCLIGDGQTYSAKRITIKDGGSICAGLWVRRSEDNLASVTLEDGARLKLDMTGNTMLSIQEPVIGEGSTIMIDAIDPDALVAQTPAKLMTWETNRSIQENVSFVVNDTIDLKESILVVADDGLYLSPRWVISADLTVKEYNWHEAIWAYSNPETGAAETKAEYRTFVGHTARAELRLQNSEGDDIGQAKHYTVTLNRPIVADQVALINKLGNGRSANVTFYYDLTTVALPQFEGDVVQVQFLPHYPIDDTNPDEGNPVTINKFEYTPLNKNEYVVTVTGAVLSITRQAKRVSLSMNVGCKGAASSISATDGLAGAYPVPGSFWNNASTHRFGTNVRETLSVFDSRGMQAATFDYWTLETKVNDEFIDFDDSKRPNAKLTTGFLAGDQANGNHPAGMKAPENGGWLASLSAINLGDADAFDLYIIMAANADAATSYPSIAVSIDGGGTWKRYGAANGMTGVLGMHAPWAGLQQAKEDRLVEGQNYLRVRLPKCDRIDIAPAVDGSNQSRKDRGLAAVQLVAISGESADYTRADAGNWSATTWAHNGQVNQAWVDGQSSSSQSTNQPMSRALMTTTSGVTVNVPVVANTVALTGTTTMTIDGSETLTTSSIDMSSFTGALILTAPVNGLVMVGPNATFLLDDQEEDATYDYQLTTDVDADTNKRGTISKTRVNRTILKQPFQLDASIVSKDAILSLDTDKSYAYQGTMSGAGIFEKRGSGTFTFDEYSEADAARKALTGGYVAAGGTLVLRGRRFGLPVEGLLRATSGARLSLVQSKAHDRVLPDGATLRADNGGALRVSGVNLFNAAFGKSPTILLNDGGIFEANNFSGSHIHVGSIVADGGANRILIMGAEAYNRQGLVIFGSQTVTSGTLTFRNTGAENNTLHVRDGSGGDDDRVTHLDIQDDEAKLVYDMAVIFDKPLQKTGGGTVTLNTPYSFTGDSAPYDITIKAGTWEQNTLIKNEGGAKVTVDTGATLKGRGTFSKDYVVTIASGATIATGEGGGSLTVGKLNLADQANIKLSTIAGSALVVTNEIKLETNATYNVSFDGPVKEPLTGEVVKVMSWPEMTLTEINKLSTINWVSPNALAANVVLEAKKDGLYLVSAKGTIYVWNGTTGDSWWTADKWLLDKDAVSFVNGSPARLQGAGGVVLDGHDGATETAVKLLLANVSTDTLSLAQQDPDAATKNSLKLTQGLWKSGMGTFVLDVPVVTAEKIPVVVDGGTLHVKSTLSTSNVAEPILQTPINLTSGGALIMEIAADKTQTLGKSVFAESARSTVTKRGLGTLTIEGGQEIFGNVHVEQGTLSLGISPIDQAISRAISYTVDPGSTLTTTTKQPFGFNPERKIVLYPESTFQPVDGTEMQGTLQLIQVQDAVDAATTVQAISGSSLAVVGDWTLDVAEALSLEVNPGLINGNKIGKMTKLGAGHLALLSATSTYSGGFDIQAGRVTLDGAISQKTSADNEDWHVYRGATLALSGGVSNGFKLNFSNAGLVLDSGATLLSEGFKESPSGTISRAQFAADSTLAFSTLEQSKVIITDFTNYGVVYVNFDAVPEGKLPVANSTAVYELLSWTSISGPNSFVLSGTSAQTIIDRGYALKVDALTKTLSLVPFGGDTGAFVWSGKTPYASETPSDNQNNWFGTTADPTSAWQQITPAEKDGDDDIVTPVAWLDTASVKLPEIPNEDFESHLGMRKSVIVGSLRDENDNQRKGYVIQALDSTLTINGDLLKIGAGDLTFKSRVVIPNGALQVNDGNLIFEGDLRDSTQGNPDFIRPIYVGEKATLTFALPTENGGNVLGNLITGDGKLVNAGLGMTTVKQSLANVSKVEVTSGTFFAAAGEAVVSQSPVTVNPGATLRWGNPTGEAVAFNTEIIGGGKFYWDGKTTTLATIARTLPITALTKGGAGRLQIEALTFASGYRPDIVLAVDGQANALMLGDSITETDPIRVGAVSGRNGYIMAQDGETTTLRTIDSRLSADATFGGAFMGQGNGRIALSLSLADQDKPYTQTLTGKSDQALGLLSVGKGVTLDLQGTWAGPAQIQGTLTGDGFLGNATASTQLAKDAIIAPKKAGDALTIRGNLSLEGGSTIVVKIDGKHNVSTIKANRVTTAATGTNKIKIMIDNPTDAFISDREIIYWDSTVPSVSDFELVDINGEPMPFTLKATFTGLKLMRVPKRQWIIVR